MFNRGLLSLNTLTFQGKLLTSLKNKTNDLFRLVLMGLTWLGWFDIGLGKELGNYDLYYSYNYSVLGIRLSLLSCLLF